MASFVVFSRALPGRRPARRGHWSHRPGTSSQGRSGTSSQLVEPFDSYGVDSRRVTRPASSHPRRRSDLPPRGDGRRRLIRCKYPGLATSDRRASPRGVATPSRRASRRAPRACGYGRSRPLGREMARLTTRVRASEVIWRLAAQGRSSARGALPMRGAMTNSGSATSSLRSFDTTVNTPASGIRPSVAERSAIRASGTNRATIVQRFRATNPAASPRWSAVKTPRARRRIRPSRTARDSVAALATSSKNTDPGRAGHGVEVSRGMGI